MNNSNNMIYLWSGKLREQINEVLLIINLTDYGKSIFSSIISKNMNFKIFFDRYNNEIKKYDEELYKLLKFISFLNTDDYFIINKPFTYKPHINLLNMPHTVGGLKFYPIGDSIFSGNPKMGNGLSYHIEFINELVEEMSLSIN